MSSQFLHNLIPNAAYVMDGNSADQRRPHSSFFSFWTNCICAAPGESHVKSHYGPLMTVNDMGRKDDDL
jgi:hypothetical protein